MSKNYTNLDLAKGYLVWAKNPDKRIDIDVPYDNLDTTRGALFRAVRLCEEDKGLLDIEAEALELLGDLDKKDKRFGFAKKKWHKSLSLYEIIDDSDSIIRINKKMDEIEGMFDPIIEKKPSNNVIPALDTSIKILMGCKTSEESPSFLSNSVTRNYHLFLTELKAVETEKAKTSIIYKNVTCPHCGAKSEIKFEQATYALFSNKEEIKEVITNIDKQNKRSHIRFLIILEIVALAMGFLTISAHFALPLLFFVASMVLIILIIREYRSKTGDWTEDEMLVHYSSFRKIGIKSQHPFNMIRQVSRNVSNYDLKPMLIPSSSDVDEYELPSLLLRYGFYPWTYPETEEGYSGWMYYDGLDSIYEGVDKESIIAKLALD